MLQRPWQLLFTRLQSYSVSLKKKSVFVMVKMKSHISPWEFTYADQQSLNPEKPLVVPMGKGRLLNNYPKKMLLLKLWLVCFIVVDWVSLCFQAGFELLIIQIIPTSNPVSGFTGIWCHVWFTSFSLMNKSSIWIFCFCYIVNIWPQSIIFLM